MPAAVICAALLALAPSKEHTVTFYSSPIRLRPAEVHNRVHPPSELPPLLSRTLANATIAVTGFDVDVVSLPSPDAAPGGDGSLERRVPLYEAYNHHFLMFLGTREGIHELYNHTAGVDPLGGKCVKPSHAHHGFGTTNGHGRHAHSGGFTQFGGASGAEFRHNPHRFPPPFAFTLSRATHFTSLLHLIDMRRAPREPPYSPPLYECPCTPQRHIDLVNGTIDGCKPRPEFACSDALLAQRNGGCSLPLYRGGYRCCEDGVFLVDTAKRDVERGPESVYYLKFALTFHEHVPARDRPLRPLSCCDVTTPSSAASGRRGFRAGNIEYDIPRCSKGTPAHLCVHTATGVQPLDAGAADADADAEVELVHAAGHAHVGALRLDLVDELTGQLVCSAVPTYGKSREAGDEEGFLVGIEPCVWGEPPLRPPPRFKRSNPMRTVAYYNSSIARTGVMSLWLLAGSVVESGRPGDAHAQAETQMPLRDSESESDRVVRTS